MMRAKALVAGVLTVGVLSLWASAASAHVTIDPSSAPQGAGDVVLTFRAPNEDPTANMTELDIQFPADHRIAVVDPLTTAGWTITTKITHLATPIKTDDGTFSDVVSEITWAGGKVPATQYGEFKVLAMGLPKDATALTFKAVQIYDNGTTVSWIETSANAAHPAPVLQLTPAADTASSSTTAPGSSTSTPAASGSGGTSDSKGLAVTALIIGIVGLVVGLGAVGLCRRKTAAPAG